MTKQETIRERIDNDIGNLLWRYYYARRNRGEITPQEEYSHRQKYVCDMKDLLARRGVVIKVDRELDEVLIGVLKSLYNRLDTDKDLAELMAIGCALDMIQANYAVEPLIKEDE